MKISPIVARLARAALRKLPKKLVREGAKAFGTSCPCFVERVADSGLDKQAWQRIADKYGITWDGWFITGAENSELTALSTAFEDDPAWLQRAVAKRLAA